LFVYDAIHYLTPTGQHKIIQLQVFIAKPSPIVEIVFQRAIKANMILKLIFEETIVSFGGLIAHFDLLLFLISIFV